MSSVMNLSRKLLCCSILISLFFTSSIFASGTHCSVFLNESNQALNAIEGLTTSGLSGANSNEYLKAIRDVVTSSNTLEGSYYNYALLADRWKSPEILPRFVSPSAEAALVKEWEGVRGPKTLDAFLPEGVTFIGHQLREAASPNVVKVQENGATVMLRVSKEEFGFDTNVAISKYVPVTYVNEAPKDRYLVRKDAKAAIIYLHGGGTPTTGAHIAESEINHYAMYNVDVVSFDMAAHGEGSRDFYSEGQEEIDGIYKFIKRAVPKGVPVFVVGHSMGGVYADIMMRQSDSEDYPMRDIIAGFGILSPAVDAKPGASAYERAVEMGRRLESQKTDPDFDIKAAPSEREIFDQMARDGKLNPIASLHIGMIMAEMNHVPPAHNGDVWTPSIMVVGEGDPLVYVGFEDLFETAFNLNNVEKHSIETAPDRDGVVKRVGHLLADYYITTTVKDPKSGKETEVTEVLPLKLVREFINKRIMEVRPEKGPLESSKNEGAKDSASIFQAYASDLVFREWVEHGRMVIKENLDGFKDIAREVPKIEAEIRSHMERVFPGATKSVLKEKNELAKLSEADVLVKLKDKHNVHAEDFRGKPYEAVRELFVRESLTAADAAKVAKLTIEKRTLESKRDGSWVPEELRSDENVKLLMSSIERSQSEIEDLRGQKGDLTRELRTTLTPLDPSNPSGPKGTLEQRKITVEAQIKQTIKDMDTFLADVLPERAKGLSDRFVDLKALFSTATEKLEQEAGESITLHGEFLASEKQRLFDKYAGDLDRVTAVIADYKEYRAKTEEMYTQEVLKGRLGDDKLKLFLDFYGDKYLTTGEIVPRSLLGRWNSIQLKIAQVEGQIYRRYISIGALEQNYWTYVNPGLVKLEVVSVKELLDRAVDENGELDAALLSKIWKQWKDIKK